MRDILAQIIGIIIIVLLFAAFLFFGKECGDKANSGK